MYRRKQPLKPGHSLLDWKKLCNLKRPVHPIRYDITIEEVQSHCLLDDAWIILNGKVYEIQDYFDFHPGGVEILLHNSGKDCTELFSKWLPEFCG
jgi:cytochrome b involved in lipid metabolism